MSDSVESAREGPVETAGIGSEVYKYLGDGENTDIVAAVKSHHAEEHDCAPSDLVGREIASGGNDPQQTYVVIVEWPK